MVPSVADHPLSAQEAKKEPPLDRQRYKEFSLSQFISSLFEGVGAALPWKFDICAYVQTRLLTAGDSCAQKVLQRYSGNERGACDFMI